LRFEIHPSNIVMASFEELPEEARKAFEEYKKAAEERRKAVEEYLKALEAEEMQNYLSCFKKY
jgi:CHAD domain-containing protein